METCRETCCDTIDNDVEVERVNDSSVGIGIDIEVDGELVVESQYY